MNYFSLRMRADSSGQHISGAERIVRSHEVPTVCAALSERAMTHPKGMAENIFITVEALDESDILRVSSVGVQEESVQRPSQAREIIEELLHPMTAHSQIVIEETFTARNMRGAMLIAADTGARCEPDVQRGVRVSHMDAHNAKDADFAGKDAAREAIVLASKVAAHSDVLAEVCVSDDPAYTTGYVCIGDTYHRLPHIKEPGSDEGARAFIIKPGADIEALIDYLENRAVLVDFEADK
ncbi:6-carboxyhexanoate--CoA ligase [Corynebacterium macginleyi]|uniref:6-carboxyhexanoate--CoA ligase n=1 Tax=Corynebacterium macginleyi TaxID=38290 RepID=UPI0019097E6D|nr:6-carboxyhexanoate--CoA ligase [Corynebacterium macginleyi]MBK4152673.1 6-carboxyhexanoate--CoA ligase [Corynebacterium macginleyi]